MHQRNQLSSSRGRDGHPRVVLPHVLQHTVNEHIEHCGCKGITLLPTEVGLHDARECALVHDLARCVINHVSKHTEELAPHSLMP
jgi:hypothetical protein